MIKAKYQSRLKRIEQISDPVKNYVYMVDRGSDGYVVRNIITGATQHMSESDYKSWCATLHQDDALIIDDVIISEDEVI